MKFESFFPFALAALFMAPPYLWAEPGADEAVDKNDPQQVLAYRGDAILTQAAIDAAFSRIPEESRIAFVRDGAKVDKLVQSLLQAETVAMDADRAGFSQEPRIMERVRLAARQELAQAWLDEQANLTPEADYAAMAYEDYLAHPEKYMSEVLLDVTHILIGTKERTAEEALALAKELKARLSADPTLFDSLVKEYSDDPSAAHNAGRFLKVRPGQMVKPFEQAAYGLSIPGQISDPVETEFGYHLIRLDKRYDAKVIPFDRVKENAEEQMRAKHIESYRTAFMQKLLQDPVIIPKGAVEVMAKRYFGENLKNAPIFTEEGIQQVDDDTGD